MRGECTVCERIKKDKKYVCLKIDVMDDIQNIWNVLFQNRHSR